MSCFTQEASRKVSEPFSWWWLSARQQENFHPVVIKMVIKNPASFGHEHLFNIAVRWGSLIDAPDGIKFFQRSEPWKKRVNGYVPRYNTWQHIHVTFFHWWKKSCYQPGMRTKPVVNNGISNYQAQLVATGFLFTSRTYEKTWDHFGLVLVFW